MKIKSITIFWYLMLFTALIILREFWLLYRSGLHIDESQSFILAAYHNKNIVTDILLITGDQFRSAMWFNDTSFSGMISDVSKLWEFNRDTPHSNLYYSLLRIWFTGIASSDFKFTLGWAIQLNIALFISSVSILSLIIYKLYKSHVIVIMGVMIAFIGADTISNTIFARPYQLQETLFIAFIYMTMVFIENQDRNFKFMFFYGLITAFTLLTGYFAIPFVLIVLFFSLIYAILNNEVSYKNLLVKCSFFTTVTLFFGYAIYPKYMFVLGYRQTEAISKTSNFFENILESFKVIDFISNNYFYPVLFIAFSMLLSITLCFRKKSDWKVYFFLITSVSVVLWSLIIMFFAPYKTVRYIYPVIPLYSLFYCVFVYFILSINKLAFYFSCFLIATSSLFVYVKNGVVEYTYERTNKVCEYSNNGNALFVIDKPWKMQIMTHCLSSSTHLMTNTDKNISDILDKNPNIEYVITDKYISWLDKIDRYAYYTIYKK
ncbi:hypothetical protein [Proteus faecis]|uniref:hypothetical protein n=1 Tax=Proteus faecis TaxID=2050967 RepID=UPI001F44061C|nr:hypothetical protein [Proteus faecis]